MRILLSLFVCLLVACATPARDLVGIVDTGTPALEISRWYIEVGTFGGGSEFHPLVLDPPGAWDLYCATWYLTPDWRLVPIDPVPCVGGMPLDRLQ